MAKESFLSIVRKAFGSSFSISRWYIPGHDGIDLAAKEGTPIYAVAAGTVEYARDARLDYNCGAGWACGGGNVVNVNIGGHKATQYAHLSRMAVTKGQTVAKGQLIGYVGRTGGVPAGKPYTPANTHIPGAQFVGAHLHFGLWDKDKGKMVDPTAFLSNLTVKPKPSKDLGAWGDVVKLPIGTILTEDIIQDMLAKLKAADARGQGCVAEGRACFFAGSDPISGAAGEEQFLAVMRSAIGKQWDKSLQEDLQKRFFTAADEANDLGGLSSAIGSLGDVFSKVAAYGAALVLVVVGLWLYSRGSGSVGQTN